MTRRAHQRVHGANERLGRTQRVGSVPILPVLVHPHAGLRGLGIEDLEEFGIHQAIADANHRLLGLGLGHLGDRSRCGRRNRNLGHHRCNRRRLSRHGRDRHGLLGRRLHLMFRLSGFGNRFVIELESLEAHRLFLRRIGRHFGSKRLRFNPQRTGVEVERIMRDRRRLDRFFGRFLGRQGRAHVQQRNVLILTEISRHHEGIGQIQIRRLHVAQCQLVTGGQLAQQGIEVCRLARHGIGPGIQIGLLAGGFVLVLGLKRAVAQQVVLLTSEVLIPQGIRRTDRIAVQGSQIGNGHVGLAMAGVVQEAFQRLAQIAFGHRPGDTGKVVALRETVRP